MGGTGSRGTLMDIDVKWHTFLVLIGMPVGYVTLMMVIIYAVVGRKRVAARLAAEAKEAEEKSGEDAEKDEKPTTKKVKKPTQQDTKKGKDSKKQR